MKFPRRRSSRGLLKRYGLCLRELLGMGYDKLQQLRMERERTLKSCLWSEEMVANYLTLSPL